MAKSTKRTSDDTVTAAAERTPKSSARRVTVTTDDIARHAYDLYLARGGEHGHDVDDWVQAERELHIDSEC
jgi:hypothetical protein